MHICFIASVALNPTPKKGRDSFVFSTLNLFTTKSFNMETQTKLRKKSFTMVEQAKVQVKGFKELYQEFEDNILISGQSSSSLENYSRKIAEVCLHFDRLPQDISEKDLNKYLADLARESRSPCLSNFKFT
jgi:hypothetical protein